MTHHWYYDLTEDHRPHHRHRTSTCFRRRFRFTELQRFMERYGVLEKKTEGAVEWFTLPLCHSPGVCPPDDALPVGGCPSVGWDPPVEGAPPQEGMMTARRRGSSAWWGREGCCRGP